jgi:hypothetical protein
LSHLQFEISVVSSKMQTHERENNVNTESIEKIRRGVEKFFTRYANHFEGESDTEADRSNQ